MLICPWVIQQGGRQWLATGSLQPLQLYTRAITQPLPFKCRKSFCKHSLNNLHNNLADKVHMLIMSEHHRLRHRRFKDLLRVTLWGSIEVTGDFPLITQCQFLYATSSIWILNADDWCHPSIPVGRNPRVKSECKNTKFWYKHVP